MEENSGLGKAIRYFDNHFDGLTCFCRIEGAMVDDNLMEAMLNFFGNVASILMNKISLFTFYG
jgi:hypothetical protein